MLVKLLRESDADAIAVIFDAPAKTFRNDIYPQYKAHRPEPPEDLIPQFAALRDAPRASNLPCVELAGSEAADLIATYARQAKEAGAGFPRLSPAKDLLQPVDGGSQAPQ